MVARSSLCLLLSTVVVIVLCSKDCKDYGSDWGNMFNGSCYRSFKNFSWSWDQAEAECQKHGAHLLAINSYREKIHVHQFVIWPLFRMNFTNDTNPDDCPDFLTPAEYRNVIGRCTPNQAPDAIFLGLLTNNQTHSANHPGTWFYTDGSPWEACLMNWMQGEPNNMMGLENRASMDPTKMTLYDITPDYAPMLCTATICELNTTAKNQNSTPAPVVKSTPGPHASTTCNSASTEILLLSSNHALMTFIKSKLLETYTHAYVKIIMSDYWWIGSQKGTYIQRPVKSLNRHNPSGVFHIHYRIATIPGSLKSRTKCEKGYVTEDGLSSCYMILDHSDYTWHQARQLCNKNNAELVIIESNNEKVFLEHLLIDRSESTFLGLEMANNSRLNFQWVDGRELNQKQSPLQWFQGEPNDLFGQEHCVWWFRARAPEHDLYYGDRGPGPYGWYMADVPCHRPAQFPNIVVCEKNYTKCPVVRASECSQEYYWPPADINKSAVLHCDGKFLIRKCTMNISHGEPEHHWSKPEVNKNTSPFSQHLYQLYNSSFSDEDMETLSRRLNVVIVGNTSQLQTLDVLLVTETLGNAASTKHNITMQNAKELFKSLDHIQLVHADILKESQLSFNTSNELQTFVDQIAIRLNESDADAEFPGRTSAFLIRDISANSTFDDYLIIRAALESHDGETHLRFCEHILAECEPLEYPMSVLIPIKAIKDLKNPNITVRLAVSAFGTGVLFHQNKIEENEDASKVLMASIMKHSMEDLQKNPLFASFDFKNNPLFISFTQKDDGMVYAKNSTVCVFWNPATSQWTDTGCVVNEKLSQRGVRTVCQCNHMTAFAAVMASNAKGLSRAYLKTLEGISYTGVSISIVCLLATLIYIAIMRKKLQRQRYFYPSLHLFLCLLMSLICFLLLDHIHHLSQSTLGCQMVAGMFHFFVLASFFWMICEAYLIYLKFVKVFNTRLKWMAAKMFIPAYGIPAITVLTNGILQNYTLHNVLLDSKQWCWLQGAALLNAFVWPIALLCAINAAFLFLIGCGVFAEPDDVLIITSRTKTRTKFLNIFFMTMILGMAWVPGTCENIPFLGQGFAFLFTVFSSTQGAWIAAVYFRMEWVTVKKFLVRVKESISGNSSQGSSEDHSMSSLNF